MSRLTLDLDALRSFVTGVDLQGYAKAADVLGRSTSAVSAHLKKLEEQTGAPLFRKSGRQLALTESGQTLLGYARRLLDLNDEAFAAVRAPQLEGRVRFGLQEDFGESLLPHVLGQFSRVHRKVLIEARIARNAELLERVKSSRLDLALVWGDTEGASIVERVGELQTCWIGNDDMADYLKNRPDEPLPLVLFDDPCPFQSMAVAALQRAGIQWRISYTSPSLAGLWAGTQAGLGLTVRTRVGLPSGLRVLEGDSHGLPPLPRLSLSLHRGDANSEPVHALAETVLASVRRAIVQ
jgi:DNA-binding transcriptional LysR family regulator